MIEAEPRAEIEGWDAPFDAVLGIEPARDACRKNRDHRARLDRERRRRRGPSVARSLAGDVLVLVRQRGPLFEAIIRALKNAGVAVAGADRLVLTEHIAIVDLMALADALLLPQDDLALAIALKSPLFGFTTITCSIWPGTAAPACARPSPRARGRMPSSPPPMRCSGAARKWRATRRRLRFFAWLLGPELGRRHMFARLGVEAADALEEFLELALDYERREPPSLQGFLAWLRSAEAVVKRDMEISRDEVRVMTVHGAKGLEAPVVILADTTTPPAGTHQPGLLAVPMPRAAPGAPPCLVWPGPKRDRRRRRRSGAGLGKGRGRA